MNQEAIPDPFEGIRSAKTWEELNTALDKAGTLNTPLYHYLPSEMKMLIDKIREGKISEVARLPEAGGVKAKVLEFIRGGVK